MVFEENFSNPSGAREHESRYTLSTNDNTLIYMRNCGVADENNIRFVANFEAPNNSNYSWLNTGRYIGVRERIGNSVQLKVYRDTTLSSTDVRVQTPADNQLRQQLWECPALDGNASSGSEVLEARVGIGSFQSVGNSKYGSRRIIPITGGSFEGNRISGDVNPGGADYQLTVNGDLSLEARYTLQADDGEIIVVRNCGDYALGSLTLPLFEAATSGSYHWMNEDNFVGTITPGLTRVIITVFERR